MFPATSSVAVTKTATDAVTSAVSNVSVLFVRDFSSSTFSSAGLYKNKKKVKRTVFIHASYFC